MAEPRTRLHIVATVRAYRRLAAELVRPDDSVLEIGASTGGATVVLAERAARVLAVEKGAAVLEQAREATAALPQVELLRHDALDVGAVYERMPRADAVFIDVGGSAPVEHTICLARVYRAAYGPRDMALRSIPLADLLTDCVSCEAMPGGRLDDIKLLPRLAGGTVAPLLALAQHRERRVRLAAAFALGKEGSPEAVRCLARLLDDPASTVSQVSRAALRSMGPAIHDELRRLLATDAPGPAARRALTGILRGADVVAGN